MADALTALEEVQGLVTELHDLCSSGRGKTIPATSAQPLARNIAKLYFEEVRPALEPVQNRGGLVDEIDFVIQGILQLATASREKEAYLGHVNELRPYLMEATVDLMKSRGTPRLILSETERSIHQTLRSLLPAAAASYEQSLRDISQGGRVSWRGTASELRETLREVIDHLAPDDQVMGAPAFQPEANQTRPTQRQKVRFILRARRSPSAAVSVVEASLETVDEAVAALARSTYQRGSTSTHVGGTAKEVRNLKRYVDAVLAELLEVG